MQVPIDRILTTLFSGVYLCVLAALCSHLFLSAPLNSYFNRLLQRHVYSGEGAMSEPPGGGDKGGALRTLIAVLAFYVVDLLGEQASFVLRGEEISRSRREAFVSVYSHSIQKLTDQEARIFGAVSEDGLRLRSSLVKLYCHAKNRVFDNSSYFTEVREWGTSVRLLRTLACFAPVFAAWAVVSLLLGLIARARGMRLAFLGRFAHFKTSRLALLLVLFLAGWRLLEWGCSRIELEYNLRVWGYYLSMEDRL